MQINVVLSLLDPQRASALRARLLLKAGAQMCIAATEAVDLPERVAQFQPDVLLLEHKTGQERATRRLLDAARSCSSGSMRILLLSDACAEATLLEAVRLGAHGCVAYDVDSSMVAKAVLCVGAGQVWFPRAWMLRQLSEQVCKPVQAAAISGDHGEKLTPREREIVGLIGSGMTNKEIARQLNISDKTVQTQLHRVYSKLHARGRFKAFAMLQGSGLATTGSAAALPQRLI